jgi:hypothetical protein
MKQRLTLLALVLSGSAFSQNYVPVAATGYNLDVIAEDSAAIDFTTGTLDENDYVLYSADYGTLFSSGSGLPNNGTITSGSRTYQLGSYALDNAIVLSTGQTDSLELTVPASYASLSLLGFATEGEGQVLFVLKFTDGSGTVFANNVLPDWFFNSGEIISGFDRAGRLTSTPDFQFSEPRMYAIDLNLSCEDQAKTLDRIMIINTTSSPTIRTSIFAVSGISPLDAQTGAVTASCAGAANGSAAVDATGGAYPLAYEWSTVPAQTAATATDLAPGAYDVIITDASGCADTITGIVIGETIVDAGIAAIGTDSLTADAAGADYQWLDCANNYAVIAGETDQIFVPSVTGNYAVAVTQNGCTDTSVCMIVNVIGLSEQQQAIVQLYPNPVSSELTIQTSEAIRSVEVTDLTGKLYQVTFVQQTLFMNGLAEGTYLVRVVTESGNISVSRVVKK